MKYVLLIYSFFCLYSIVLGYSEYENHEQPIKVEAVDGFNEHDNDIEDDIDDDTDFEDPTSNCWMTFNAAPHFKILDQIDKRYATIRKEVQESLKEIDFDKSMIDGFKRERGVALREIYAHHHNTWMIPSGLNLGGFTMLRMPESVLFFHRMKLRNNTYFRVDYLHNDLSDMVVRMHLSLNDLHLMGAYERSLTDRDPAVLVYAPTFGQVEFLMKNVKYKMEGRYRLIKNRLLIELVCSEILVTDVMMTYITKAIESAPKKVDRSNLGAFIDRLKTDLDEWLKDYFNDYMIYAEMDGIPHIDELSKYDKEKGTVLQEFTDKAIQAIDTRIRQLNAANIRLPTFTFKSIHGLQIKLHDGILYGLDSMYRRSVPTGYSQTKDVRKIDTIVGFSNLKVVYKYEAVIPTGVPPLTGTVTLSANELAAHLALAIVVDPETVDLDLKFLDQMKPESLTVEGAANIVISNFKHLLEHQIVAIMSNTLLHGILALRALPRCVPFVPGVVPDRNVTEKEKEENYSDVFLSSGSREGLNDTESVASDIDSIMRSHRPPLRHPMNNLKSLTKQKKIKDKKKNEMKLKKYKRKSKKATIRN